MTDEFIVSEWLPVDPDTLYRAWLDSSEHTSFTGSIAEINPIIGGKHSAWDGYIEGVILALEPGTRIVQSWRTNEFPEDARESRVEVRFIPENGGTRLEIRQTDVPAGHGKKYEDGWRDFYFEPLKKHYGRDDAPTRKMPMPAAVTRKPMAKQPAKKKAKKSAAKKVAKKSVAKKNTAQKKPAKKKTVKKKAPKVTKKSAKKKAGNPTAKRKAKKKAKKHR